MHAFIQKSVLWQTKKNRTKSSQHKRPLKRQENSFHRKKTTILDPLLKKRAWNLSVLHGKGLLGFWQTDRGESLTILFLYGSLNASALSARVFFPLTKKEKRKEGCLLASS
jgi:hypothetical protein